MKLGKEHASGADDIWREKDGHVAPSGEGPWRHWCHGERAERAERGNQVKGGNLSMERSQRCPPQSLSSPRREGDDLSMERLSPTLGQAGWTVGGVRKGSGRGSDRNMARQEDQRVMCNLGG